MEINHALKIEEKLMSMNHAYSPYGAFEMKASYQRNMFYGNLAVLGLVTLLLILSWLLASNVVIPHVPPTVDPNEGFESNPLEPKISGTIRIERIVSKLPFKQGTIPTMISDTLFLDDGDIELIVVDEIVGVGGVGDEPFDPRESTGNIVGIVGGGGGIYPEEDQFVPHEKEPEMFHQVQPKYPRLCRMAGIEGKVIIKVLIDKVGNVVKAKIAKSSGNESLDKAALEVASENRFSPALQNSIPISLWASYTVEFRLR